MRKQSPPTQEAEQVALLRMIDAATNRALEGMRVVEDAVRFGWDDRHLLTRLKQLRHRIASSADRISQTDRVRCRDTLADVGTDLRTSRETERSGLVPILNANLRRSQEALRTLAEASKAIDSIAAEIFEQSRYELYTLEKSILTMVNSQRELADARLYVLVDGQEDESAFERAIRMLVQEEVGVIQLRDKRLSDRELVSRAKLLRRLTSHTATLFVMNDRADLAVISDADGVHVGQSEVTVKDARKIVGPRRLVGVSTHSIEQARQAVLEGADYIGVGPVYASPTKSFEEFPGVELVRMVSADIRLPAYAIGGITLDNISQIIRDGLHRAAVQSAVWNSVDPQATVKLLKSALVRSTMNQESC